MIKKLFKINKNSFRFKIAFYYLVASLFVVLIFSGVIYTVVSNIIVEETVSKTEMSIKASSESIGEIIRYKKSLLQLYSSDKTLQAFALGEKDKESEILKQISALAQSDANILGVFVTLNDGYTIISTETILSDTSTDITTQTPCLTNDHTGVYQHNDEWIVSLALPIYNQDGTQIGVVGIDLDYCIFSHTFENLNLGQEDFVFIQDSEENLIFRSDKIYESVGNVDLALSSMLDNGYDAKTNTLVYNIAIPNTDWTMVSVVMPNGLNVLKRQLFDMVILTALLLSFALIVITVIASRNLTDPISRLVTAMEDIQELAELSISKNEISETAILTHSYNRMVKKIKDLMQELEEKQVALRNAEFNALTSQINPHFLYNTLDTIVWLAEFKDTEKIIKLTKSLAAFFRLSLNGGRSVVALEDEIEHVKQYLIIQKERYGDKFDYSFDIDENTLDIMVPKIILQPIVENAIYHGIKPMDTNGIITIKTQMQDMFLIITISDNGIGFNNSNNFTPVKKVGGGVGLKNVEERIKLFYSGDSQLKITSSESGTEINLILDKSHSDEKTDLIS